MSSYLLRRAAAQQRGRDAGTLVSLESTVEIIRDSGVDVRTFFLWIFCLTMFQFCIRHVPSLARKPVAAGMPSMVPDAPKMRTNPFLPYDETLFVEDAPPSHVVLLNKFAIVPGHALIVTRAFEPQDAGPCLADFSASLRYLSAERALLFFNCGAHSGASQPHRHMQLMPMPGGVPIDAVVGPAAAAAPADVFQVPSLPFLHLAVRTPWLADAGESAAERVYELYKSLRARLEAAAGGEQSHAFLLVDTWMMVVPRRKEAVGGVSVNSSGFAGTLLAKTAEDRMEIEGAGGPMAVLASVGFPPKSLV